jgi:hypothetical protein
MAVEITNYDVSPIVNNITDAKKLVDEAKSFITQAKSKVPSQITSDFDVSSLTTNLDEISKRCDFASNGITDNVNNYKNYEQNNYSGTFGAALKELDPEAYNSISSSNEFYWDYLIHTNARPVKADASFFSNLKVGSFDNSTGIYTIQDSSTGTSYSYHVSSGTLTTTYSDGKTTKGYVAYFYPPGNTDYSNMNTITFLPGSGEHPKSNQYVLDNKDGMKTVLSGKTQALIISPQDSENYSRVANKIVNSTTFAKNFLNQNSNCVNSLVGFSAGAVSAVKIANETNLYDVIVPVNGGGYNFTGNLKDKQFIIMESAGDNKNHINNAIKLTNYLKTIGNEKVSVISNNSSLLQAGTDNGYNTQTANDSDWTYHSSAWHMIGDSGLMEYLGDIKN